MNDALNGISDRIRELRIGHGLSQTDVADKFGIKPQAVSQWENGSTKPSRNRLELLAKFFHCSVTYLLTGQQTEEDYNWERAHKDGIPESHSIPIVGYIEAANWLGGAVQPDDEVFNPSFLSTDQPISSDAFALEIRDNSMLPQFRTGDRIIADPAIEPRPGDFVVATIEGDIEATFKKYKLSGYSEDRTPIVELVPLNSDYPTLRLDENRRGQIIATMIEHRRYRQR